ACKILFAYGCAGFAVPPAGYLAGPAAVGKSEEGKCCLPVPGVCSDIAVQARPGHVHFVVYNFEITSTTVLCITEVCEV
ncbi:hypothetical protein U1Q18_051657, partial [Sarracenia purpurea var. burkii]